MGLGLRAWRVPRNPGFHSFRAEGLGFGWLWWLSAVSVGGRGGGCILRVSVQAFRLRFLAFRGCRVQGFGFSIWFLLQLRTQNTHSNLIVPQAKALCQKGPNFAIDGSGMWDLGSRGAKALDRV